MKRPSSLSRRRTAKRISSQLSKKFSANPVRQSDHGARVSIETAITFNATVASTTQSRPRSKGSAVVIELGVGANGVMRAADSA
jgi:hypothetical protein